MKNELLKQLCDAGIIHRERVTLRSGEVSDFYCDIKKAYGDPALLNALADALGQMLPPGTTCVAGSGYGGLPLAAVIASRHKLAFVGVRASEKSYGKAGAITGCVPQPHDEVVIIDDVLTSGSSIKETYGALQQEHISARCALVVVARAEPELPLSHEALFSIEEILAEV